MDSILFILRPQRYEYICNPQNLFAKEFDKYANSVTISRVSAVLRQYRWNFDGRNKKSFICVFPEKICQSATGTCYMIDI